MARNWDARRGATTLSTAAVGTVAVLAALGLLSAALAVPYADAGAAFVVAGVFWIGSAVLVLPVTAAAVVGIVLGARTGVWPPIVLGALALAGVALGVWWFLTL
ncbi:hypothetical protein [Antiquaquibacter soli]|uniref:Uncharacterized protein n=1 Tax=Antiquaquibacter soli TaxID=3064523 RepID=A0ABT9BPB1_9MICO|nr:hypothetical protein [Protaetiibacter sp. WY-16]MDO7882868.1 hypothetical protein [Protaetiibacter sp. WY-16]